MLARVLESDAASAALDHCSAFLRQSSGVITANPSRKEAFYRGAFYNDEKR